MSTEYLSIYLCLQFLSSVSYSFQYAGLSPPWLNLFILKILFIFGCIGSSLLRMGFLQLWRAWATLCCCARASHRGGFSCCGARALGTRASVVAARRLSSCGAWAQLLCGMRDLPGPGIKPVSSALAGVFLTIAPPGKSSLVKFIVKYQAGQKVRSGFSVTPYGTNFLANPLFYSFS